ncbi:major pollen allergen Ole e 10-like isoform X2 [Elaeis guineensis]|uniref:Major pollen allergen Ole e 10-like isoform X2 n=1 Tax=Elaeis guineensis var. tenera TaxID=51953 RepID=A0A6I9QCM5_ELAGV|nr:major pollen allergen Ole e 10-like isoform X2 [Elaeis guineensis]
MNSLLTSPKRKTMARKIEASTSLAFFFPLLLLSLALGRAIASSQGQKTWCVAKPSSDEATLTGNLNYACSQVDCKVLQKDCLCFYPDNLISHASVAMNLYYQARGRNYWNCYFRNSGLVSTTDPSFGNCSYVYY